jgi:hypothetical protein
VQKVGAKSAARDIYFAPDLEWLPILRIQGHTISSFGALADPRVHPRSGASAEVILSAVLALIVAGLGVLLALAG